MSLPHYEREKLLRTAQKSFPLANQWGQFKSGIDAGSLSKKEHRILLLGAVACFRREFWGQNIEGDYNLDEPPSKFKPNLAVKLISM